ncbi:hypothetical protein G5V59_03540 [Nocardioides sp. W3-2-3]|uniref:hypothetical protein n=1 Tax=Nocardioides convexus TaxID=2712224 RepID=UPI0024186BF6|nr:hypothetical protein [Nocardioides convexus]NGZ99744.1 hypothetical protein [Nocardioides convexus]
MTAEKATSKVLTKGDGAALKDGDVVKVEFTLADGWTHKVTYDELPGHQAQPGGPHRGEARRPDQPVRRARARPRRPGQGRPDHRQPDRGGRRERQGVRPVLRQPGRDPAGRPRHRQPGRHALRRRHRRPRPARGQGAAGPRVGAEGRREGRHPHRSRLRRRPGRQRPGSGSRC